MTAQQGLTVLGLGSVGAATAGRLQKLLPEGVNIRILAIDTDRNKLEKTDIPRENRLLAAEDWRNGRGCGGEVLDGQRALAHERSAIEKLIGNPEFLLVTAAFGGGTATGGAGIIQSICRKNDIPVIFLATLPFAQEGHSRRQAAEDAIRQDLLNGADAVLALPNDLRASGDTRFVLLSSTASMWIMRVGLGILMGTVWGIGLLGIWIAMLADWAVRIALFVPRFLGHRWETKGIKE